MASILSLSTAIPKHCYEQEKTADKFIDILDICEEKALFVKKIYSQSAIKKRYSVLGDFHLDKEDWSFWGPDFPQTIPGMAERNDLYKKEAPLLAEKVAREALEKWGGEKEKITHIISVSCTGMIAPGIEYHLMESLSLSPKVNRLGINFMGCFGAFKGLSVAKAFAIENPEARILLVCTELCSLHLQTAMDSETLTANALFSDGAAAAVIGCQPTPQEAGLWEIKRTQSKGFKNSMEKMSWEAGNHGFRMRLSPTVPVLIKREMQAFAQDLLLNDVLVEECEWAIHPGGKSILQAVEKALHLTSDQTVASWDILANYGNMSSATFLFVLNKLAGEKNQKTWTAGVGFGPGLSAEGILLKRC